MVRWRSRCGILLVGIVVGMAAIVGSVTGRWFSPAAASRPHTPPVPLHVKPTHLDFGEAWETEQFVWSVPIQNSGSSQVELNGLSGSCNCASVEPDTLTIPPGETRTLRLTLDLRPQAWEKPNQANRSFATVVTGSIKNRADRVTPVSWKVVGRVKRAIRTTNAIEFGQRSELTRPIPSITIPVEPLTDIENLTASSSLPEFRADIRPASGQKPGWELVVSPALDLKRGAYKGTITLTPAGHGGALPSLQLPLTAEVVSDVEAIPAMVQFGGREVGMEVVETVTLRSHSDRPFVVERVETVGAVHVVALEGGGSYQVFAQVTTAGPNASQVRFVVRPQGGEPIEVVVPVQVHGLSPQ